MGRKLNQLTPTASLGHYFGAEVRRLRQARGLSQQGLAQLVLHSADLVRKVEAATRIPSRHLVERCDEVLGARGSLTRMWPMLERERSRRSVQFRAAGYSSELSDRPVLDWLIESTPSAMGPPAYCRSADMERLRQLRRVDQEQGAGSTYPQLSDFLGSGLADLADERPALAAGFLELAGYDAIDLGADGLAQHHYLRALDIATASADRLYGGYLIGVSLGHLALHVGDPQQALRLASAAMQGLGKTATPAVRAAIGAVVARAHARLGSEAESFAALRQVEADLDRDSADRPEWIGYFGAADLADEKAHCFFDLRLDGPATREALTAVVSMNSSRVRRLAIDTALYASALARSGDVDAACAAGRQAVDHAAHTISFRSAHRVVLMMAELHGYDSVQVWELADYAATALPSIPAITAACS